MLRFRRLAATALVVAAATGVSGCCDSGLVTFLFADTCADDPIRVEIEIEAPAGPVVAGQPVRLKLNVSSALRVAHDYYWDLDGDRRKDVHQGESQVPGGGTQLEHRFPRAGRVRVSAEVRAIDGNRIGSGRASLDINVVSVSEAPAANHPPVAEIVAPDVVARGDGFLLDGRGSRDEDGVVVRHSWDVLGDAEPEFTGSVREWIYDTPGEKVVTLTVEDDRGATAQARQTILVTGDDRAAARAAAPRAGTRRFSARLTGLLPARAPKPTARGLALSGIRGSGSLRATLGSPSAALRPLTRARWRGRLRFTFQAGTGAARLRGTVVARGRGPTRVCLRLAVTAPPFGRPVRGRLTVLGGTRHAALLRGSARFTVARVNSAAAHLRGRFRFRARDHARGPAACRA